MLKNKKHPALSSSKKAIKKYNTAEHNELKYEVNEAAAVYNKTLSFDNPLSIKYKNPDNKNDEVILIGAAKKPESKMTSVEKMNVVRSGVTKKDLESLKAKTKLGYDNLAKALSVTRATLINKKNMEKFNAVVSERIISLADIYSYGYEVFEDEDRFNRWMFTPIRALGGQMPFDLMDNQFGRQEVRDIIGRIDYGVYS